MMQRNGKTFHAHWIRRTGIIKMSVLPKANYTFNAIPSKYQQYFSQNYNNLKICMEPQKTPNSQSNLKKEKQSWRHHNLDFKLYYKAVVIKTVWHWHKNRHTEQWNTIKSQK